MDLYGEPVVYVDIETSGSNVATSKIIEIGIVRVESGQVVKEYKALINPGSPLPYWITKLTGIHDHDVAGAPYFEDLAHEINSLLQGAIFIAHNVRFDYSYIKRQLESYGYNFNPKLLCTVRLSRALYADQKGHSLQKLIERHNIPVSARHRALDDAKAIKHFAELAYHEHGAEMFSAAMARQIKTRSLPPNLDESYMQGIQNKPGVYVFEDESGAPMYVGKSVTIRNRVLSHFNQDTKVAKEMRISQSTHKLRTIQTNSELEALLLESKMIKDLMPVHNRKLRRQRKSFVLQKDQNLDGYTTIDVGDVELSTLQDLASIYGVYSSRGKAKAMLQERLRTFDLCSKLTGLEKTKHACFLYQLGKCRGACIGAEPASLYNLRVEVALQQNKLESWKYKTPMVISTADGTNVVVDNWIVLGFIEQYDDSPPVYREVERSFDIDTYRILRSFIKKHVGNLKIVPFSQSQFSSF